MSARETQLSFCTCVCVCVCVHACVCVCVCVCDLLSVGLHPTLSGGGDVVSGLTGRHAVNEPMVFSQRWDPHTSPSESRHSFTSAEQMLQLRSAYTHTHSSLHDDSDWHSYTLLAVWELHTPKYKYSVKPREKIKTINSHFQLYYNNCNFLLRLYNDLILFFLHVLI